jgi:thiaminase (transcriptional activator TenA)
VTFSDDLRAATARTWDAAVTHRFVDETWAGRLDPAVLRAYLVQRKQVQDPLVALLGAAVALTDRADARLSHARRLGVVVGPEDNFMGRAMDVLDVPLDDRTHPVLTGPTRELRELMDAVRLSGDHLACLTVLLVTEWVHRDWAARPDAVAPTDSLPREWTELHLGTSVESRVALLRSELDRVTAALDDEGRDRIGALFTRTAELELAFFDAAYT